MALLKPTRVAIRSMVSSDSSSIRSASSTRWLVIQWYGVVPVSALKRRANVRGDIIAFAARTRR